MSEDRVNKRNAVLARLQQGPATSIDLNSICYRYGARILELRKQGYDISTRKHDGTFLYTLNVHAA